MASRNKWPAGLLIFGSAIGTAVLARAMFKSSDGEATEPTPDFVGHVIRLLRAFEAAHFRVKIGPLRRTPDQQQTAVDEGRSGTDSSKHLKARALDVYPIDTATNKPDYQGRHIDLYRRMVQIATGLGWKSLAFNADGSLRYLTNKQGSKFWDGGHLER